MSDLFQVVVDGTLEAGKEKADVYESIGKLFKIQGEKLDVVFSGKKIAIKRKVDHATAKKYQAAISRAGLICSIEPMPSAPGANTNINNEPPVAKSVDNTGVEENASQASSSGGGDGKQEVHKAGKQVEGVKQKAPRNFRLAPPGARVSPISKPPPPPPNVDHIGLSPRAPFEQKQTVVDKVPDTSGLSLGEPGVRLGEEKQQPQVDINLDHIQLDELGATMDQAEKSTPKAAPDVSHLNVEEDP